MKDLSVLPDGLPVPQDDGACDHLAGRDLPSVDLPSTADRSVDLSRVAGLSVIYFYPLTGSPDAPPMPGWNEIPGARGCTPQSCAFRDFYHEILELGVTNLFGASAQALAEQKAAVERLHLPFELLNDSAFGLTDALNLPTFRYQQRRLSKRLTMIVEDGNILKVFYPVFPPNENATEVMTWLKAGRIR